MVTEFFVRIFVYGLSGFVLGNGHTTVLLPTAAGHKAFLAFESRACSPTPCPLTTDGFQRVALAGDQIDIPQLATPGNPPGHTRQGRSPMADRLGTSFDLTLPLFESDSIAIDWLPRMDNLGTSGTVDPDCMAGAAAKTCNGANGANRGLQGRLVLASGVLSTCHLIETSTSGPNCSGEVHTFTFSQVSPLVEQALADVEVDVTKVTAADLTLTLTKLGADHPWQTIKLAPVPCFDNPTASCVDIFVGNMPPPPPPATDCSVQRQGDHFAALYALLAPGLQGSPPIPIQDLDHFKPAADVQVDCRQVPPLTGVATTMKQFQALAELPHLRRLTDEDRKKERHFLDAYLFRAFKFDPHYPYQRPICPMAAFNPSASP